MAAIPTILVFDSARDLECLINTSDFDPEVHTAVEEDAPTPATETLPAFNPKTVLRGKISVIVARIQEVANADLPVLRDAEVAGKARSAVLAAIDAAQGG